MSELAYDISHLLETELSTAEGPVLRMVPTPPPAVEFQITVAAAQDALGQELMQAADAHEAMIQQYLRLCSDITHDAFGH